MDKRIKEKSQFSQRRFSTMISVIIPTLDREKDVIELIQSIQHQTLLPDEIIIVDQAETNKLKYLIEELPKDNIEIKYYKIKNKSLTQAKNHGIKQARGDFLFFFDDDLILKENFIEKMLSSFKKSDYMGGCGICVQSPDFKIDRNIKLELLTKIFYIRSLKNGKFLKNGLPSFPILSEKLTDTEFVSGGITVYKREVFNEFMFEEKFTEYCYLEDAEFSYRVSRKYELFFNPDAIAYHKQNYEDFFSFKKTFFFMQNYIFHFKKNVPKNFVSIFLFIWSIIGLFICALIKRNLKAVKGYAFGLFKIIK